MAPRTQPDVSAPVTDVLGEPYLAETITLADDAEGAVVATLVSRRAAEPTTTAVLYVHGFSDYFFQTELADFFVGRGHDFYALDLRKYGRSLREHQTPAYVDSLREYDEELNAAWQLITERDGHTEVVLVAHSTGGLILPLWAGARREALTQLRGLVLNSPWFDLRGPAVLRTAAVGTILKGVAKARPKRALSLPGGSPYGATLHADHAGEFTFDVAWKPMAGMPVNPGWIAAIRRGHARLHRGLGLQVPCLVLTSDRTGRVRSLDHPDAHATDLVLDVEQIRRWAPALGNHVTEITIAGGRHDLFLSVPAVRATAYDTVGTWWDAWVS